MTALLLTVVLTGVVFGAYRLSTQAAAAWRSASLLQTQTHLVLERSVDAGDAAAVVGLLDRHDVRLEPRVDGNRVWIDGHDATAALHTDRVDAHVSSVAAHPQVRQWVMDELRELAGPFVVEGRDMGTAVFPAARSKFYLTASPEERARRRVGERSGDLADVATAIRRRDERDAKQLRPATDAVHIDTDALSPDDVVDAVLANLDRTARPTRSP